jgi:hypothetical protein
MGLAIVVAYGGRSPALYISRKLAWKCHKILEKKKERVGKEKRVRGRSNEALSVLRFIVSISLILTLLAPILRNRI